MITNEKPLLNAVGSILKDMQAEIRRTDRGAALVQEVQRLRIAETVRGLRTFVRSLAHERSRLIEARGEPPPWLAAQDAERKP